jgi:hypothetical protein
MSEHTTETYAVVFTATSNSEGSAEVLAVPQGGSFDVDAVKVYGELVGSENVTVGTFTGESRLAPTNADVALTANELVLPADTTLFPGDTVQARWENTSGTDRTITVVVIGERE